MVYKDLERKRKMQKAWRVNNKSTYKASFRKWYRKEHPNAKHYDSYCDFETHRELAMSSGIQTKQEWRECFRLELFPDGIYSNPDQAFRRK